MKKELGTAVDSREPIADHPKHWQDAFKSCPDVWEEKEPTLWRYGHEE